MRAFAITGMVTASWISAILSGSAMRATPPSRRMSAGTRSSAMTAQAPASSAIRACSASTTSMITPPLSISARPLFTRMVPMSAIAEILVREESRHFVAEAVTRLDEDDVAAGGKQHGLPVRDRVEVRRTDGPGDEVVLAGDHQRGRGDPGELGTEVEGLEDLVVEEQERIGDGGLASQGLEVCLLGLAVAREVERKLAKRQLPEL